MYFCMYVLNESMNHCFTNGKQALAYHEILDGKF